MGYKLKWIKHKLGNNHVTELLYIKFQQNQWKDSKDICKSSIMPCEVAHTNKTHTVILLIVVFDI